MQSKRRSVLPILWIWLVAGTLDITENLVFNQFRGISPWRVFRYLPTKLCREIRVRSKYPRGQPAVFVLDN